MPAVSVVLPLFGDHPARHTLPAVAAAWLAQDVRCEVLVATAADTAVELSRDDRIRVLSGGPPAPGTLRNLAASVARAAMLYLGDADIVPVGADFLRRALALCANGDALVQPWMYRLVNHAEIGTAPAWRDPGPVRACLVTGDRSGRLTPVPGERFHRIDRSLWAEPPPHLVNPADSPEMVFRCPFHWGGVLVRKDQFDRVGGYCTRYVGWGCEDDDLFAKLGTVTRLVHAWRAARTLRCLHFEHPRSYAGPALDANRRILDQRLAGGHEAMIAQDLRASSPSVAGR
ncbi:hypothetical protein Vau01_118120 [Virgisporangium aurantiacum]|uniref:Galactosyltransferase C-terminal domain-containing protein n=1 Tax=Virgisporangium aurantiacum TaxID=175570 RepID=A0A8J3ZMK7_9ACTN|nr:hypothetical protein Vau01_118120 [Virgisporangium aurantiacum]